METVDDNYKLAVHVGCGGCICLSGSVLFVLLDDYTCQHNRQGPESYNSHPHSPCNGMAPLDINKASHLDNKAHTASSGFKISYVFSGLET